jgi:membrane-bound lytic murein transglycosylase A
MVSVVPLVPGCRGAGGDAPHPDTPDDRAATHSTDRAVPDAHRRAVAGMTTASRLGALARVRRDATRHLVAPVAALILAACSTSPPVAVGPRPAPTPPVATSSPPGSAAETGTARPAKANASAASPATAPSSAATSTAPSGRPAVPVEAARLEPVDFDALPGWADDDVGAGFVTFLRGCPALKTAPWPTLCAQATRVAADDVAARRRFLETAFVPHRVVAADGNDTGLLTGYYEPLLRGSRTPDATFRHPVFAPPDDLVGVDLGDVVPDAKALRLRGRVVGRKLVPYWTRADIDAGRAPLLAGRELAWVDDPVALFFLHVQGSGRVQLPDGSRMRVGYADQNGHPYRSIGRLLVERGELTVDQASMQGIKAWGARYPQKLPALLAENPSYVFFRELPPGDDGPPGSLGVPLTAGRSLAVDPRVVPLGAPVWIDTTWPGPTPAPLRRLVVAQDTGGAIKGAVRADWFTGFGDEAGELAGRTRQPLRVWVLLPKP